VESDGLRCGPTSLNELKYLGSHHRLQCIKGHSAFNLKDFDRQELAEVGVAAETPDAFLCRLLADSPEEVIAAFVRMRDNLRNPPKTTRECAHTLATC
jgi:hypothetical protein